MLDSARVRRRRGAITAVVTAAAALSLVATASPGLAAALPADATGTSYYVSADGQAGVGVSASSRRDRTGAAPGVTVTVIGTSAEGCSTVSR